MWVNLLFIYLLIGFIIAMFISDLHLHNMYLITLIWPLYLIVLLLVLPYEYFTTPKKSKDCGCNN